MPTTVTAPIVADLGNTRAEDVEQLRRGAGQLVSDLEEVMKSVRLHVASDGENRVLLPLVVIYTEADANELD